MIFFLKKIHSPFFSFAHFLSELYKNAISSPTVQHNSFILLFVLYKNAISSLTVQHNSFILLFVL